jgi:hypothetical protein
MLALTETITRFLCLCFFIKLLLIVPLDTVIYQANFQFLFYTNVKLLRKWFVNQWSLSASSELSAISQRWCWTFSDLAALVLNFQQSLSAGAELQAIYLRWCWTFSDLSTLVLNFQRSLCAGAELSAISSALVLNFQWSPWQRWLWTSSLSMSSMIHSQKVCETILVPFYRSDWESAVSPIMLMIKPPFPLTVLAVNKQLFQQCRYKKDSSYLKSLILKAYETIVFKGTQTLDILST